MIEHPHGYIGFSHCLDCAKHAYDNDTEELRAENERLKAATICPSTGKTWEWHFKDLVESDADVTPVATLQQENERLKQSMVQHFSEEHLAGDGPEIDYWKAQNRQLEQRNAELRAQVKAAQAHMEDEAYQCRECERLAEQLKAYVQG